VTEYECSMPMLLTRMRVPLLAIIVTCCPLAPTQAQDAASAWANAPKSAARLIAAAAGEGTAGEGAYRAGIEIKLAPATITYWRSPGESGVPPVFDFSHSSNLRSAEVSFPAPQRIEEGGSEVFGYGSGVVLPVRVTPQEPGKPVDLVLDLDYAACEKICLPVHASLRLGLPAKDTSETPAITAAESRVPRRLSAQEIARDVAIIPLAGSDKPTWRLHWRGPPVADLFAEPPDLFFMETKRDGEDFLVAMAEHPKDAPASDVPVRFTLTGASPVEFALHLDADAARP
jgi:DsbC/DsbD-like thiol-disulfide interchange protein